MIRQIWSEYIIPYWCGYVKPNWGTFIALIPLYLYFIGIWREKRKLRKEKKEKENRTIKGICDELADNYEFIHRMVFFRSEQDIQNKVFTMERLLLKVIQT